MKKFNLFKMLAVLVVLMTSIPQMWAKEIFLEAGYWLADGPKIKLVAWDTGGNWTYEMSQYSGTIYHVNINDAYTNCRFERWSGDGKTKWTDSGDQTIGNKNRCVLTSYSSLYWDQMIEVKGGTIYFDNSLMNWTPTEDIQFFHGDDAYTYTYVDNMANITNTKLWYKNLSSGNGAANYVRFADADYTSNSFKSDNKPTRRTDAYRGVYSFNSSQLYLFTTASGDNDAAVSPTWMGEYGHFNKTITLAAKVKAAGGSYSAGESKGALNASSYTFSDYNTCGTSSGGTPVVASGSTSGTFSAGYTASTTLSVTSVAEGYTFEGWYDSDGGPLSASTTYTDYCPKADATIYAYFEEKTFSVSFTNDGHGIVTSPASSPKTVGQITGIAINASNSTGYHFDRWTITSGTGSFTSAATIASNTFKPTAAATIRANFAANPYTITLNGNGGTGNTGSVTATFDSNTLSASITNPTRDGYVFQGWYSGEGGTGEMIINPSGVLQANVTVSSTQYTGAGGIWKKAGDTNLYAKWLDVANAESTCWDDGEYKCGYITELAMPAPRATSWADEESWGGTPTINTKVVIPENTNITVDVEHAKAKEIVLGSGSSLTIGVNDEDDEIYGLEVAGTITDAEGNALTASNLTLESCADGNASLIFTNSNSTAAAVDMYSIAKNNSGTWYWQYVGIPFTGGTALDYFNGKYLYKFSGTSWSPVGGYDDVEPFVGYCFSQESADELSMSGTLVGNDDVDISVATGESKVFANSWTAPIYIGGFTAETFTSAPATIYLFNTGSAAKGSSSGSKGSAAGTYVAVPVKSADYTGNEVIPSMQGFFIHATTGGTNTMKYDDLVRTTKNDHSVNAGAMYAPKRVKAENDPDVIKIWAESSIYSDKLVILAREDFSTGFDNGWDGEKKGIVSNAPAIYVLNENSDKDAVSAIPDFEGTVVGFKPATSETEYAVRFEYDGEETLYLNDQKAEESALIATGETYNFNANSEDNEARFVISRTPIKKITTSVENVVDGSHARKQMINGQLYIVRDGQIYDMLGKTIQ